jgi:molybdopterin-guanine dinucleotide biosynthesis protein B
MRHQTLIAVVGSKKSGKTTVIEILTKELAGKGYRVAVAKHIPEPDFTMDTEGKDTWRFARSGAKTVIAVSNGEIATVEKTHTRRPSLKEILQRCRSNDVVFLEGFRELVARRKHVHKIVVLKSEHDVSTAVDTFEPISVFTGPYRPTVTLNAPYFDVLKDAEKISDLIERLMKKER